MCDAYENNPNPYIINYEEMFHIILNKIHEEFTIDVSFTSVFYYCIKLFEVLFKKYFQYDISEEEREDECTNRISTYLLCVQSLITSSVKYQKEGLFEIFQTIRNQQINLGQYLF